MSSEFATSHSSGDAVYYNVSGADQGVRHDESNNLDERSPADSITDGITVESHALQGRQRRIHACIALPYSASQIWQILTDYEHLADFIPSLVQSRCLIHPEGGTRVEQIGAESLFRLKFCARVVLDMLETFPHEIGFTMVEGDFKSFSGMWQLQPLEDQVTELHYVLFVVPPLAMPVGMIERRLRQNMVVNMQAIRQRADELFARSNTL